jgi:hypothetical protein
MFYAVDGSKEFIYLTGLDKVQLVAKRQIIGVVITGLETVRIDTNLPGISFCLNYKAILQPQSSSVFELADAINDMLNNVSAKISKAAKTA